MFCQMGCEDIDVNGNTTQIITIFNIFFLIDNKSIINTHM